MLCFRFCFVELADPSKLKAALKLSGKVFKGTTLKIELAKDGSAKTKDAANKKSKKPEKSAGDPSKYDEIRCYYTSRICFYSVMLL